MSSVRERIPRATIRVQPITKGQISSPTAVTYQSDDLKIFVKPASAAATVDNVAAYQVTVRNANVVPETTAVYVINKDLAIAGTGVAVPVPQNGLSYGIRVAEVGFDSVVGTSSSEQSVLALKLNAPTITGREARNGSVTLRWAAPTGLPTGFAVTSYKLSYETSAGSLSTNIPLTTVTTTATSYTVTGLVNNDNYRFLLSAIVTGERETPVALAFYSPVAEPTGLTGVVSINGGTNQLQLRIATTNAPTDTTAVASAAILSYIRTGTGGVPNSQTIAAGTYGASKQLIVSSGISFDATYNVSVTFTNRWNSSVPVTMTSNFVRSPQYPGAVISGQFNLGSSTSATLFLNITARDPIVSVTFNGQTQSNIGTGNTVSFSKMENIGNNSSLTVTWSYTVTLAGVPGSQTFNTSRTFVRNGLTAA